MIAEHARIAPARAPRPGYREERLLVIDPLTRRFGDYASAELPALFDAGDLLIVNDAATLPASLRVDEGLELRLLGGDASGAFSAVALGAGDWSEPTEQRGAPPVLRPGQRLELGPDLAAEVLEVDAREPRLVTLRFETSGADFFAALYRHGRPIQYAYAQRRFELWDVQNRFASRPWAFELPSAGRPLTFETLFELERRGARVSYLTHAAGISSSGSAELDARLPLRERYDISLDAACAVSHARELGGRVIATGTSVLRALEAAASPGGLVAPGEGETDLRVTAAFEPRVVDGLLTGLHEPGTSHFELLESLAPRPLLERALAHAARTGYLQHEFGDSCLVLAGALSGAPRA